MMVVAEEPCVVAGVSDLVGEEENWRAVHQDGDDETGDEAEGEHCPFHGS